MRNKSALEVLVVCLRLGCQCFGGPVAHIGYFRQEFVVRRQWLDERAYADLMALCQFLPGPTSSQVSMGIGLIRAGVPGALAAWIGFTLPSVLLMLAFAFGMLAAGDALGAGWLKGLKVMAVAVVAQAVWGMARNLCPDRLRQGFAVVAAILVLAWPGAVGQVGAIAVGALLGRLLLHGQVGDGGSALTLSIGRRIGAAALVLFFVLLAALPLAALATGNGVVTVFDSFYRSGALVFGGGHVLLPLLQTQVVAPGWVDADTFLAGYGAAQALPGPLFSIAAYLGAVMKPAGGLGMAMLCLFAIFVPAFLLLIGALPFWNALRARPGVRSALMGVNAAVVGLLVAVLYHPVWTDTIHGTADFILLLLAFGALTVLRLPPWLVAPLAAVGGAVFALL